MSVSSDTRSGRQGDQVTHHKPSSDASTPVSTSATANALPTTPSSSSSSCRASLSIGANPRASTLISKASPPAHLFEDDEAGDDVLDLLNSKPVLVSPIVAAAAAKVTSNSAIVVGSGSAAKSDVGVGTAAGAKAMEPAAGISPGNSQGTQMRKGPPPPKPRLQKVETTPIIFYTVPDLTELPPSEQQNNLQPTQQVTSTTASSHAQQPLRPSLSPSANSGMLTDRKRGSSSMPAVLPPLQPPLSPSLSPEATPTQHKVLQAIAPPPPLANLHTSHGTKILNASGATEADLKDAAEVVRQALEKGSPEVSSSDLVAAAAAETAAVAASVGAPPPPQIPDRISTEFKILEREEQGNKAVAEVVARRAQEADYQALLDRATFIDMDPNKEMILKLYTCTWNMFGLPPPPLSELEKFIPPDTFDIYVIGTEECENSIAMSFLFSSKAKWVAALTELMGNSYVEVCSETLQAIHCIMFVRRELRPMISRIETQSVATGIADMIGNKGAVALSMDIGMTSFLFVNGHFTSGEGACERRNEDYRKINSRLTLRQDAPRVRILEPPKPTPEAEAAIRGEMLHLRRGLQRNSMPTTAAASRPPAPQACETLSTISELSESVESSPLPGDENPFETPTQSDSSLTSSVTASGSHFARQRIYSEGRLQDPVRHSHFTTITEDKGQHSLPDSTSNSNSESELIDAAFDATSRFDCVIWMGDFNYRVKTSREFVEVLLRTGDRDTLLNNDELIEEMNAGRVFAGCVEAPVKFPPTYKYDLDSDNYDSSEKRRTPSWTDRIVWKRNPTKILLEKYDSCRTVRTSDHRPVFAHFLIRITRKSGHGHL